MPVHHLVVAWPPPIHQPVLFFQLLPPGVHRAGHLPRSQPIAVTPTLSTASMNFLCGFHLFLLHCSSIHSILCPKYSWSVLYTSKPAESPLSLFLIQLSKFDNLIFIQRMMVYNPYRGACYIWRHLYLSLWGKPSSVRTAEQELKTEPISGWMKTAVHHFLYLHAGCALRTPKLGVYEQCSPAVCLLCWCMK